MKFSIYLTPTRATAATGGLPPTTGTVVTPFEEGHGLLTTLTAAMPRLLSESSRQSSTTPTTMEGRREVVEKIRFQEREIESERNTKRRKTSYILDSADKTTTNWNILLPLDGLLQFLQQRFCCKKCRKSIKTLPNEQPHHPPLVLEVFGLACGLNFQCACRAKASLRPPVVAEEQEKVATLVAGRPFSMRVNSGNFQINRRLQLGLQLCGDGRQDGKILAGMLNLNVWPMQRWWTEVQELVGKFIIQVGEEVLKENLHIECLLSPVGDDGRHTLDIASDTRWDKGEARAAMILCLVAL
jgi:hypothetical protein